MMGRHQIRRLPIAENGVPVGMVSLSDVAQRKGHKSHVAKSLKEISKSQGTHRLHPVKRGLLLVALGLGLFAGAAVALNLFPHSRDKLWERLQASRIGDRLLGAVQTGRGKMAERPDSM